MPRSRTHSASLYNRAARVIPGGVNSPVRAFQAVGGEPLFIRDADGAEIVDADGNTYIDYVGSWGPLILGHRPPVVLEALAEVLGRGTSFGAPTDLEVEMAELICGIVPSVEMVRMVNSGTEACMTALRLARGVTGRDHVIKFNGCYHGHSDGLLVEAGSGVATFGISGSPGVPGDVARCTASIEFNDLDLLRRTVDGIGPGRVAAVILEPVPGNMGLVPPGEGFFQGVRDLCTEHGILLIFDEVMTGFRVALGGAQERFGITPDLSTYSKVIGGGLPVGAFGGRAELMSQLAPAGPVYQAGTLSGNPLAMTAGLATLRHLRDTDPYDRLEALGRRWVEGMRSAAAGCRRVRPPSPTAAPWWACSSTPARCATTPTLARPTPASSSATSGACSRRASTWLPPPSRPASCRRGTPRRWWTAPWKPRPGSSAASRKTRRERAASRLPLPRRG